MKNYVVVPYSSSRDSIEERWNKGVSIGVLSTSGNEVRAVQENHAYDSGNSGARLGAFYNDGVVNLLYVYPTDSSSPAGYISFLTETEGVISYVAEIERLPMAVSVIKGYANGAIDLPFIALTDLIFHVYDDKQSAWKGLTGSDPPDYVDPDDPSTPAGYTGVVVQVTGILIDEMDEGGTSVTEVPNGNFDDSTDIISEPALPNISAQGSGMITLYRPSLTQVRNLGEYVWTHIDDFIENLQKWVTNPISYIVAFHIVPCVPSVSETRAINIGNFLTTIEMPPCVSQWYTFDFGYVKVNPFSGTYLDYSPYTKIQLMLPFIGSVSLNTDEVMNATVGVKYRIDLLSGQCVALVSINNSYLYQYTGQCSVPIPLTGNDWSRVYSAAISAVGTAIVGGVSAASGSGIAWRQASTTAMKASNQAMETFRKASKGAASVRELVAENAKLALENARTASETIGSTSRGLKASQVASAVSGTVNSVMGAKQSITHSGTVSGTAGMLGVKQPYIWIEYPNQSLAENYKHFVGYPSNISGKVKDFTGYTECEQVVPNGFTGTDVELAEVLDLLKEGVYL